MSKRLKSLNFGGLFEKVLPHFGTPKFCQILSFPYNHLAYLKYFDLIKDKKVWFLEDSFGGSSHRGTPNFRQAPALLKAIIVHSMIHLRFVLKQKEAILQHTA